MFPPNSRLAGHGEILQFRKTEHFCNLELSQFLDVPGFQVDRWEVYRRTDVLGKCDVLILLQVFLRHPIIVI
jgi:hypothetical protein